MGGGGGNIDNHFPALFFPNEFYNRIIVSKIGRKLSSGASRVIHFMVKDLKSQKGPSEQLPVSLAY